MFSQAIMEQNDIGYHIMKCVMIMMLMMSCVVLGAPYAQLRLLNPCQCVELGEDPGRKRQEEPSVICRAPTSFQL